MWKTLLAVSIQCALSVAVLADATDQVDALVSVARPGGLEQRGVLTTVRGDSPETLVLLFPGDPSVLKAQIADGKLVQSRVGGNPLVRARYLLVRPGLATVLVDCRSDYAEQCSEGYIMSRDRFDDVQALMSEVTRNLSRASSVWVVGHSLGSLASASLARYGEGVFVGAIHTSAILASRATYKSLVGFDFSAARIPQLFIHHQDDPCPGTPLQEAKWVAARHRIPLAVITEASGVRGGNCGPFSQHGFAGAEKQFMDTIYAATVRGVGKAD